MRKLFKPIFVASLLILLSACAGEEGYKVQVEPSLPVPILIVPDHGSSNTPNNNQTTYPNNNQNDSSRRDNQSDSHRTKRQRSNKNGTISNPNQPQYNPPPSYNQPPYNNDGQQQDYRY